MLNSCLHHCCHLRTCQIMFSRDGVGVFRGAGVFCVCGAGVYNSNAVGGYGACN